MDSNERLSREREAKRRIAGQRRRVGMLRSRVIATSLICFAVLWAVVFVQMATGNDPVLGEGRRTVGATAAPPEHRTDSREASGAAAAEAIETTSPEEIESEVVEPEPVETESPELEPEPEPLPVETAQS